MRLSIMAPKHRSRKGTVTNVAKGSVIPLARLEKQAILAAMKVLRGDKIRAARLLGIGKTTLYRRLKEYRYKD